MDYDYLDLENPIITAEDSRLRDEYTQVVKSPSSGYRTYFKVSRGDIFQQFEILDNATPERANWYALMLARAIGRLIKNETEQIQSSQNR